MKFWRNQIAKAEMSGVWQNAMRNAQVQLSRFREK
jgi:hypothetical protein